jgi:DNA-binding NarL/FixJ family response regulator
MHANVNVMPALVAEFAPGIGTIEDEEWQRVASSMALTPQQARVVRLILGSRADKQIAREIGVSFGTVRTHLSRIFERTGTSGRMELAALVFTRLMELREREREGKRKRERKEGRQSC